MSDNKCQGDREEVFSDKVHELVVPKSWVGCSNS